MKNRLKNLHNTALEYYAFFDRGRVFFDGIEEQDNWRDGYGFGFGFYIVPLNESFTISLAAGFSDEERVYPIFSIGTPLR